jgi:hypothetical protein
MRQLVGPIDPMTLPAWVIIDWSHIDAAEARHRKG